MVQALQYKQFISHKFKQTLTSVLNTELKQDHFPKPCLVRGGGKANPKFNDKINPQLCFM